MLGKQSAICMNTVTIQVGYRYSFNASMQSGVIWGCVTFLVTQKPHAHTVDYMSGLSWLVLQQDEMKR